MQERDVSEQPCPFCGRDPFHYVDNGLGMEPIAVTCCELGVELYSRSPSETVGISRADFDGIAGKLCHSAALVAALEDARRVLAMADRSQAWQAERDRVVGCISAALAANPSGRET
jgi:hypothetical protein